MTNLINKAEVKRRIPNLPLSNEFFQKLEVQVIELLLRAEERAKLNHRRTLLSQDI